MRQADLDEACSHLRAWPVLGSLLDSGGLKKKIEDFEERRRAALDERCHVSFRGYSQLDQRIQNLNEELGLLRFRLTIAVWLQKVCGRLSKKAPRALEAPESL